MHSKNFVHRDIKPDNFLMGLGQSSSICHVVDMGLAKYFIDPATKEHIPHITGKSLTGTARYVSIHSHKGEELSRRDDFEAIGYVLIYFYTGSLPWQHLRCSSKDKRYQEIQEMKMSTSLRDLCYGCPHEFIEYFEYCKKLEFKDKPDYTYLKGIFQRIANNEGINLFDQLYDWSIRAVTIKSFSDYYDFIDNQDSNPLND
jgi:serine/threonine protein kinase